MAQLGVKFDPTAHDTEQRSFSLLPDGIYTLHVTASEVKATSDGDGQGLSLTYQVLEPEEYADQKIFEWINLRNKSAISQKIGEERLAALCRAMGISDQIEDSDELHFHRFTGDVVTQPESTNKKTGKVYKASNKVDRLYYPDIAAVPEAKAAPVPANDNQPAAVNDNTPATAPAAAAGGAKRPWKK